MKLVSLKSDHAFKGLFSHENVRRQFLSDVLGIPPERVRSVRVASPHLPGVFRWQKEGVLDMSLVLNDEADVNLEMQVRVKNHWTKRELFYLARLYTRGLKAGQSYDRLRRCVSIGILDFRLTEGEACHTSYRLRSRDGTELTDLFEVHIIELKKPPQGTDPVDDWVRLFNAQREEDLEMIKTKSAGLLEAIEALKTMSLSRPLYYMYEEWLKAKRDRAAEDDYVRDEGIAIGEARGEARGITIGEAKGEAKGLAESILYLLGKHGGIPAQLADRIMAERDTDTLKMWLSAAASAESVQQFQETCGI